MARVKWVEEKVFIGTDNNGRAAVMSSGNDGPGVSPMQMLLLGLGGCAMIDVVSIVEKQRMTLTDAYVEVSGERGETPPRPWETIHMHFVLTGVDLDLHKVERAIDLAVEKYCGAHATLSGVAAITHDCEVRAALAAPAHEAPAV
jgi:putative redox protein